jgi:chitinase
MKQLLIFLVLFSIPLSAATEIVYAGYVPTYRMSSLADYDYDNLTHVFAAFGNPDSSGTMSISLDIDTFVSVVTANEKTKAYLSIGGGGDYSWGPKVSVYEHLFADTNRTMFVNEIVDYLIEHNLDGVDADIEGNALKLANCDVFTQELADSVHAKGLEITAALGQGSYGAKNISDVTLSKFDLIMTMSYGGINQWNWDTPSNDASFERFISDIEYFVGRGVAPGKVAGGIPFYAVEFPADSQANFGPYHHPVSIILTSEEYESQDPFNSDTVYSEEGNPIFLNGWPTIKKKIDYTDSTDYAGIMIWELGQDNYGDGFSMGGAIYQYLEDPTQEIKFPELPEIEDEEEDDVSIKSIATPTSLVNKTSISEVKLYNLKGRQILSVGSGSLNNLPALKSNLSSGVYIMKEIDVNGVAIMSRFSVE